MPLVQGMGMAINKGGGSNKKTYIPASILSNLKFAWSTRRLLKTYTGAAIRQETSDGVGGDVYFNSAGKITLSGADNAFVRKYYAQIGGVNLSTIFALAPQIYNGSTTLNAPSFSNDRLTAESDTAIKAIFDGAGVSVSFWVKSTQNAAFKYMFRYSSATTGIFSIILDSQIVKAYIKSAIVQNTTINIADGNWHHIVLTVNNTAGTANGAKIYIDTTERLSITTPGVTSFSRNLSLMGDDVSGDYCIGSQNDTSVYDKVLSSAEVSAIYTLQRGYYGV